MTERPNETERRRWNDPYWSGVWPRREQLTGAVTPALFEHLQLQPGERVLDIGSGAGITALEAAKLVGTTGEVVGADISAPLVAFSTRRAQDEDATNIRFVVADVQEEKIPGAPFDVALSQFGVMFFESPRAAFQNIRGHLREGGRLGFACWQVAKNNRWHLSRALAPFVPPPPPPAPGASATGPFSLGDPTYTKGILQDAGFHDIGHTALDLVAIVGPDAIVDEDQLVFLGVTEDRLAAAREAVAAHLAQFARPDGRYDAPLAVQVFTATS
ncbi:MAG TPA: class I SAM-dependent methyltransferase [Acidimicrobiales bacterium]